MSSNDTEAATFAIKDTKFCVPVVNLSTQDNAKLLEQLKSGFKRITNWNVYESKLAVQAPSSYLNFLINTAFQGVNRFFVLLFESNEDRTVYTKYYLPLAWILGLLYQNIYRIQKEISSKNFNHTKHICLPFN